MLQTKSREASNALGDRCGGEESKGGGELGGSVLIPAMAVILGRCRTQTVKMSASITTVAARTSSEKASVNSETGTIEDILMRHRSAPGLLLPSGSFLRPLRVDRKEFSTAVTEFL